MCQMCFRLCTLDDLVVDEMGARWDICKRCEEDGMGPLPERDKPTGTRNVGSDESIGNLIRGIWTMRTGRHLGRTLYIQFGSEPDDGDRCIGMVDSVALARTICERFNNHRG